MRFILVDQNLKKKKQKYTHNKVIMATDDLSVSKTMYA